MDAVKIDHAIRDEFLAFIIDRQARRLSHHTIRYYQKELEWFRLWLADRQIKLVHEISSTVIREYLIALGETRNPGGVHASYRTIKAFFNWFAAELDDLEIAYRNPIRKVQPPKVSREPIQGVTPLEIETLLLTCDRTQLGQRDRAILLFLFDTGLRADECLKLNFGDIDLKTGAVQIRAGKGNKSRIVFVGFRCRKEVIKWLRYRGAIPPNSPLWITRSSTRLTHAGLRQILRRRAAIAGIPEPQIHDFRRAFAIECLRNGMDLVTLMRLMGHTSTTVLQRYLRLVDDDLRNSHERSSPADNL